MLKNWKIFISGFLILADGKKDLKDEDLIVLMDGKLNDNNIEVGDVQIISGKPLQPVATVALKIRGDIYRESATGNGSINAAFNAINNIIDHQITLDNFEVQSLVHGCREGGKVSLRVLYNNINYFGYSEHDDLVMASVEAYVNAINKMVFVKKKAVKVKLNLAS